MFDSWAPSIARDEGGGDSLAEFNLHFLKDAGQLFGLKLDIAEEAVLRMGKDEVLEHIISEAQRANVATVGLRQIRGMRDVSFQNAQAERNHVPRPYDGAVALFSAKDHPLPPSAPKDHGWGALMIRGLELYEMSGDHYTMLRMPLVERLAEQLRKSLSSVQGKDEGVAT